MNVDKEILDERVEALRRRAADVGRALQANLAVAVLMLVVTAVGVALPRATADTRHAVGPVLSLFTLVAFIAGAVTFVQWLRAAYETAPWLEVRSLQYSPSQVAWSFFIPFVNLVRPYRALRDLSDALAPDGVPEPAPSARPDPVSGYRENAAVPLPAPVVTAAAPFGLWWTFWLLSRVFRQFPGYTSPAEVREVTGPIVYHSIRFAGHVFNIAAALLAMLVVKGVMARVMERHRRLYYSP